MNLKQFFQLIFVMTALVFFVSCSEDEKEENTNPTSKITEAELLGCWESSYESNGETIPIYYNFNEDGTYVHVIKDDIQEDNWVLSEDGTSIQLETGDPAAIVKSFENGVLVLTITDGETVDRTFVRSSDCPEPNPYENYIDVEIDGKFYVSQELSNVSFKETGGIKGKGSSNNFSFNFSLTFDENIQNGIYDFAVDDINGSVYRLDLPIFLAKTGELEIIENNELGCKGTFDFTARGEGVGGETFDIQVVGEFEVQK
jgi:hypothetical protein